MDEVEVNNIFHSLVDDIELSSDLLDSDFEALDDDTESIDHIKEQILSCLADQLVAIDALSISDDEYEDALSNLTEMLHQDFSAIEGLELNDEVVVSGESIIMVVDEESIMSAIPIPPGSEIVGILEMILVTDVPTFDSLPALYEDPTQFTAEVNPVPLMKFGASLMLQAPVIVNSDGSTDTFPDGYEVLIPINYPQVQLKRIV